jgi:1-acyl-sn-glycerol-3-phosphate acyltransferase
VNLLYRAGHSLYRVLFRVTGGVRVYGRECLPTTGAYLICANHCSLLDPPLIGSTFSREIGYLAKKELFKYPVLSSVLRAVGAVPVNRTRLGRDTVNSMVQTLKTGRPMVFFPEGTRSRTGKLGSAKLGVGFLARLTGVDAVPAFIRNTGRWPFTLRREYHISVHFGPPVSAEWMAKVPKDKAGYQKIADEIMDRIRILQSGAAGATFSTGQGMAVKPRGNEVDNSTTCPMGQI